MSAVDPSIQDLIDVQEYFNLPDAALVEKDWYVVKALAAIMEANTAPFRLVFGGGTSLSRAHGVIRRMSEDIDLKIVGDREPTRPELRQLRAIVTQALLDAGFRFDPENRVNRDSRNESRYTIFRLPYEPLLHGEGVLRPGIQIEMAVWPLYRMTVNLPVCSFVAEAFKRAPEMASIPCVAITQTAAEKFVAMTRRMAAELANVDGRRDATLVRHVYDLHVLRSHYDWLKWPPWPARSCLMMLTCLAISFRPIVMIPSRSRNVRFLHCKPIQATLKAMRSFCRIWFMGKKWSSPPVLAR